jgi:hypothetical protein
LGSPWSYSGYSCRREGWVGGWVGGWHMLGTFTPAAWSH